MRGFTERRLTQAKLQRWLTPIRERQMFKMIGAAAALATLALASSASAGTVVYSQSGNTLELNIQNGPFAGAGTYEIGFTSSLVVDLYINSFYDEHYDIFIAPPPKPHEENIHGNDYDVWNSAYFKTAHATWTVVIPRDYYRFWTAGPGEYEWAGVTEGTELYEWRRYTQHKFEVYADHNNYAAPFDYTLTVTRISGVPEPATWAMLVAGFGLAGSALRRRNAVTA